MTAYRLLADSQADLDVASLPVATRGNGEPPTVNRQPFEQLPLSGIDAIYVFGSRAREIYRRVAKGFDDGGENCEGPRKSAAGQSDVDSDVDIGVQLGGGSTLSARERVELAIALEDLLGVARVDLVILQEADPFLALDIIKGELLYCADPDSQAEYELYVLRRAGDLAPFEYERRRQVLEAAGR